MALAYRLTLLAKSEAKLKVRLYFSSALAGAITTKHYATTTAEQGDGGPNEGGAASGVISDGDRDRRSLEPEAELHNSPPSSSTAPTVHPDDRGGDGERNGAAEEPEQERERDDITIQSVVSISLFSLPHAELGEVMLFLQPSELQIMAHGLTRAERDLDFWANVVNVPSLQVPSSLCPYIHSLKCSTVDIDPMTPSDARD